MLSLEKLKEAVMHGKTAFIDPRFQKRSFAESKLAEIIPLCWRYDPRQRIDIFQLVDLLRNAVEENKAHQKWYMQWTAFYGYNIVWRLIFPSVLFCRLLPGFKSRSGISCFIWVHATHSVVAVVLTVVTWFAQLFDSTMTFNGISRFLYIDMMRKETCFEDRGDQPKVLVYLEIGLICCTTMQPHEHHRPIRITRASVRAGQWRCSSNNAATFEERNSIDVPHSMVSNHTFVDVMDWKCSS